MTIEEYKKIKPAKYRNVRVDGYDSLKERERHHELLLLQDAGRISDLRRQVKFELIPTQRDTYGRIIEREVSYYADFVYMQNEELIVEDCKGIRTRDYIIKRKMLLKKYGMRILET